MLENRNALLVQVFRISSPWIPVILVAPHTDTVVRSTEYMPLGSRPAIPMLIAVGFIAPDHFLPYCLAGNY